MSLSICRRSVFTGQTAQPGRWRALFTGRWPRAVACTVLLQVLTACSPDLNWREVRLDGVEGRVMFPCRPDHHQRTIMVAGQPRTWRLTACEAGGWQFAIGQVEVSDPTQVDDVLRFLRQASATQLKSVSVVAVPGATFGPVATPFAQAGRWQLQGMAPDDRVRLMDMALGAKGPRVVQAIVLGGAAAPSSLHAPFWESLPSLLR